MPKWRTGSVARGLRHRVALCQSGSRRTSNGRPPPRASASPVRLWLPDKRKSKTTTSTTSHNSAHGIARYMRALRARISALASLRSACYGSPGKNRLPMRCVQLKRPRSSQFCGPLSPASLAIVQRQPLYFSGASEAGQVDQSTKPDAAGHEVAGPALGQEAK